MVTSSAGARLGVGAVGVGAAVGAAARGRRARHRRRRVESLVEPRLAPLLASGVAGEHVVHEVLHRVRPEVRRGMVRVGVTAPRRLAAVGGAPHGIALHVVHRGACVCVHATPALRATRTQYLRGVALAHAL